MMPQRNQEKAIATAASIWFEFWGSWIRVKKISISTGKFPKNLNFFRQFYKRISSFAGKFPKILIFSGNKKIDFASKKVHLQLPLGKLFYFSSKVKTFEHTSLYMIRYNNISRPVHDSNDTPCDPPFDPPAQNLGIATLSSQDYRPWIAMEKKPFPGGKNYQGED